VAPTKEARTVYPAVLVTPSHNNHPAGAVTPVYIVIEPTGAKNCVAEGANLLYVTALLAIFASLIAEASMFVPVEIPCANVLTSLKLVFTCVATAGVPAVNKFVYEKVAIIIL
jgi:hypothetical protein